jgi:hypothetical protein
MSAERGAGKEKWEILSLYTEHVTDCIALNQKYMYMDVMVLCRFAKPTPFRWRSPSRRLYLTTCFQYEHSSSHTSSSVRQLEMDSDAPPYGALIFLSLASSGLPCSRSLCGLTFFPFLRSDSSASLIAASRSLMRASSASTISRH